MRDSEDAELLALALGDVPSNDNEFRVDVLRNGNVKYVLSAMVSVGGDGVSLRAIEVFNACNSLLSICTCRSNSLILCRSIAAIFFCSAFAPCCCGERGWNAGRAMVDVDDDVTWGDVGGVKEGRLTISLLDQRLKKPLSTLEEGDVLAADLPDSTRSVVNISPGRRRSVIRFEIMLSRSRADGLLSAA